MASGEASTELRADYIEGEITRSEKFEYQKTRKESGPHRICSVRGHWTEDLYIDNELLWHIDDFKGFNLRPLPLEVTLPSDSRHREDLIELLKGDEESGQVCYIHNAFSDGRKC